MTTEIVLSKIEYKGKDAVNADFWKECYTKGEFEAMKIGGDERWYRYTVKFNNTTPVQITKIERI
jgi:CO dehydrogenase/acetyl-CoA synthase gamma subunit (corrinoid Fe-S protein)